MREGEAEAVVEPLRPDFLRKVLAETCERFTQLQHPEGHWAFSLEADTTIPAEYLLLQRFLGRTPEPALQTDLANYLRRHQLPDGGWPLFHDGAADISATVKSYFALKLCGDSIEAPHMARARELVLSLGGAERVNVFTRITLALFGQLPWHTTPAMPIEIMLLPRWFFFHLEKVSYWSRTVIVPLLILYATRACCPLPREEGVAELFQTPPQSLRHLDGFNGGLRAKNLFIVLDRLLKRLERFFPRSSRQRALRIAEKWTRQRMGEGGIGAIFPAMANAVMALHTLGYREEEDADLRRGLQALEDLLQRKDGEALCQPCVSPVWDTCLGLSASLEAGLAPDHPAACRAAAWLLEHQVLLPGDWSIRSPNVAPGGWAFQFENNFYPDVDDTPMVVMALLRAGMADAPEPRERIGLAVDWVLGMQSSDGGWGAFDIDNNRLYLNHIPFADHGALLDPSTSDVTARCVEMLSMLGYGRDFPPLARALEFLRREQEPSGAWFGRWGVNYIYGTWSVLMALHQVGEDMGQPWVRRAVDWLKSCQNPDGGWGETCYSYDDPALAGQGASTASQTAWALLGLLAAGEVRSETVEKGVHYLLATRNREGEWEEAFFTGTGFPRVFYLRYHGYRRYFPLWALGLYRRLSSGLPSRQEEVRQRAVTAGAGAEAR